MAEAPAMPLWTDAYLADTMHLSTVEHGAYLLILMTMWRAGGRLPNDPDLLRKYARLTAGQWRRYENSIMAFFQVDGAEIFQGRLTDELAFVRQRSKRQSSNARAKYRKNNGVNGAMVLPRDSHSSAPTPTPTPTPNSKKKTYKKEFEDWYSGYPKKVGKGQAERAFAAAIKNTDLETLKTGLERYVAFIEATGLERQFIKNPATWLNGKCWADEYGETRRKSIKELREERESLGH